MQASQDALVLRSGSARLVSKPGATVWAQWHELRHAAAVIGSAFCVCVRPRCWVRPVRKTFARQVLAVGVEPIWFVGAIAMFVGMLVVLQFTFWVGEAGWSQLLGSCTNM